MMRYLDIETPRIRAPKRIVIDTEKIARMIYDDSSLDFMDDSIDEE